MTACIFAAKLAARLFLMQVWKRRDEILPAVDSTREVLVCAPDLIAQRLGIRVERVPFIRGGENIAGFLDRTGRLIQIASSFSLPSQRFTFAHELGHWVLHTGNDYFRDRSLSSPGGDHRPYYEIEADAFAAELLVPRKHLTSIFCEVFRGPIDGTAIDQFLADAVSLGKRRRWTPQALASATPLDRAKAIANAGYYKDRHFIPLMEYFKVSRTAMAIQLLRAGLVA